MPHVYYIQNTINQKLYIGFTSRADANLRIKEHFYDSVIQASQHKPLYRAILKYGKDAFSSGILFSHTDYDHTLQKEIELIEMFSSEYNISKGGNVPPSQKGRSRKHTEEAKQKMRKPKAPRTSEHTANQAATLRGRPSPLKGIPSGKESWNKGTRISGSVKLWKIIRENKEPEIINNLVLWCETNSYITNTVKHRYYKKFFPYLDIISIYQI